MNLIWKDAETSTIMLNARYYNWLMTFLDGMQENELIFNEMTYLQLTNYLKTYFDETARFFRIFTASNIFQSEFLNRSQDIIQTEGIEKLRKYSPDVYKLACGEVRRQLGLERDSQTNHILDPRITVD